MNTIRPRSMLVALYLVGSLLGCGKESPPEPDLEGMWRLAMPAGFKFDVPIEYMGNLQYRIASDGNLGGVYELKGNELRMLNPENQGTRHYVWKIEDGTSLVLIEAPTAGEVGSDYRGAALTR